MTNKSNNGLSLPIAMIIISLLLIASVSLLSITSTRRNQSIILPVVEVSYLANSSAFHVGLQNFAQFFDAALAADPSLFYWDIDLDLDNSADEIETVVGDAVVDALIYVLAHPNMAALLHDESNGGFENSWMGIDTFSISHVYDDTLGDEVLWTTVDVLWRAPVDLDGNPLPANPNYVEFVATIDLRTPIAP